MNNSFGSSVSSLFARAERVEALMVRVLVFLMVLLPFVMPFHYMPATTFFQEMVAMVCGVLIVAIVAWRSGLLFRIEFIAPLLLVALALLQMQMGYAVAVHDLLGLVLFVVLAVLMVSALLAYFNRHQDDRLVEFAALGVVVGGAANIVVMVIQGVVPDVPFVFYPSNFGATGNIGQRNLLITYIFIAYVSVVLLYERSRLNLAVAAPIVATLAFGLAFAGGRSALLYLFLYAGAVLLSGGSRNNSPRRTLLLILVAAFALWSVVDPWLRSMMPLIRETSLSERMLSTGSGGLVDGVRILLWTISWEMFRDNPLLGVGLGSFDQAAFWRPLGLGPDPGIFPNTQHAHNVLAHFAGEMGFFALLPFGTVFYYFLLRAKKDSVDAVHWATAVTGVLIVHSLIEFPLWYFHFLALLVVALAIQANRPSGTLLAASFARLVSIGITAAALIFMPIIVRDYREIENLPKAMRNDPDVFSTANTRLRQLPLLGRYALNFHASTLSYGAFRIYEKAALCDRAVKDFADWVVLARCVNVMGYAGQAHYGREIAARLCHLNSRSAMVFGLDGPCRERQQSPGFTGGTMSALE